MSAGVVIVVALLKAGGVTVSLPDGAAGIHVPEAALGAHMPLLIVEQISRVERRTVARNEDKLLVTYRIRVHALAERYDLVAALLEAVRLAAGNAIGAVAGYTGVHTQCDQGGPDEYDAARGVCGQYQDFIVRCHEQGYPAP